MQPLDRFSGHAAQYAQFRITYPPALYEFLLSITPGREAAWDCGTGNGQVASDLAEYFARVEATDISEQQLAQAAPKPNINYRVSRAEQTPFAADSFDLITVAQALHWFDADAFHREARRVARPGATIAEWGYGLVQVNADIDALVQHFYTDIVGPYWDENRRHIDDRFARIPFPFVDMQLHDFEERQSWDAERFLRYLQTWSSVQRYRTEVGEEPLRQIEQPLRELWGKDKREVRFPIFLRAGKIHK
ncbi:class I SAM-dependent methyltransferase [Hymenobacter busanensis]|uniref:Class I SAM-dependent methyltransferase n=1 Tax=Hymenobacter busanensis TaxID=2607656 RepID=A0A7L4ZZE7_9BACT|nr:class I SAM-dependent methyltransferase [Hymenobacter busanensis]KAA9338675.1 class I SAM-dependent methyltransferase [Hymenobacter busanensis]QHJ08894.1 methyltransferase domain-containing protein [Hymenobacter busanensis]